MITKDSRNILIADDSVFFRAKLSDILVEAGHKVRFAKDGRELISEVKIDSNGIDLLILDLQMPDIDGFGVLQWIADEGLSGAFPVLVITGVYEPGEIMDRLRSLGASGLMTKGLTPEQIIFRVNRLLFPEKVAQGQPRMRVPVSLPVDYMLGDMTRTGFLLNISETGTFLHTKAELLPGALLRLLFSLPGSERVLDLKVIVKWSTAEVAKKTLFGGYGLMFTSVSADDLEYIKAFVSAEAKRLGLEEEHS
jgi:CheY-like chemotaxis protein